MAKTDFQKSVDAAKAKMEARKSETEKEDLETMVPLVGSVMGKAAGALEEARYIRDNLTKDMPMVTEVNQAINVLEFTLGKAYATGVQRLADLNGEEPEELPPEQ